MTTTHENEPKDMALEAFFEYGATLPVEYGTPEYDNLREIAREVGAALVKADADSDTRDRKELSALALVSSVVEHYPDLVKLSGISDNPEVEGVLVDLIHEGVTEVDAFLDPVDPTKFDESDDPVSNILDGLRGAIEKARQYNDEVKKGVDGIEPVVMSDDESYQDLIEEGDISLEDLPEEGPLVEESDNPDEIEGSTF